MEFNSLEFLLLFLPSVILTIGFIPKYCFQILLISSLIFYSWNSTIGTLLLLFSSFIVHRFRGDHSSNLKKIVISLFIISPFLFFRSSNYIVNAIPLLSEIQERYPSALILPAGVSFYTFQSRNRKSNH